MYARTRGPRKRRILYQRRRVLAAQIRVLPVVPVVAILPHTCACQDTVIWLPPRPQTLSGRSLHPLGSLSLGGGGLSHHLSGVVFHLLPCWMGACDKYKRTVTEITCSLGNLCILGPDWRSRAHGTELPLAFSCAIEDPENSFLLLLFFFTLLRRLVHRHAVGL